MPVTDDERATTIEWYKAFRTAGESMDPDQYLSYLTDDCILTTTGRPPTHGKAAISEQIRMFYAIMDSKKFEIDLDTIVVLADRVITQGTYNYYVKGVPKPFVVSVRSEIFKTPRDSLITKHCLEGDFPEMTAALEAMLRAKAE